jgi:curved DNA-binding protein CbpA
VEVGQAYAILKNAKARKEYDRELASSGGSRPQKSQTHGNQSQQQQQQQSHAQTYYQQQSSIEVDDKDFDNFMRMFDETVSGMSEAELNMAMGAASVIGGVIGSIIGARAGRGNAAISSAVSMLGSALASQAAGRLVREVHEDSKQRTIERREIDAAIARGETPTQETMSRDRVYQDASKAFQRAAGAAVIGTASSAMASTTSSRRERTNEAASDSGGGSQRQGRGFSLAQAAELACEAARIYEAMQQNKGSSTSK